MRHNLRLRVILLEEPRLQPIIEEAVQLKSGPDYSRIRVAAALKAKTETLVGWMAENRSLRTKAQQLVVFKVIDDLLPPDSADKFRLGHWFR
jgi:hypothetical protein